MSFFCLASAHRVDDFFPPQTRRNISLSPNPLPDLQMCVHHVCLTRLTSFTVLRGGMWSAMYVDGARVPHVWHPKFFPSTASAWRLASVAYSRVAGIEAENLSRRAVSYNLFYIVDSRQAGYKLLVQRVFRLSFLFDRWCLIYFRSIISL